jgi:uncharacterized membrane protein
VESDIFASEGFLWDPMFGVTSLGETNVSDLSINNLGVVVGNGFGSDLTAFMWDTDTGFTDLLPVFGLNWASVTDINDNGQISGGGGVNEDGVGVSGFVWDPVNGVVDLGSPRSNFPFYGGANGAYALNNRNQVAGGAGATSCGAAGSCALLWNIDKPDNPIILQDFDDAQRGIAYGINDHNQVVGSFRGPSFQDPERAFYWDPNVGDVLLSTLIDPLDPLLGIDFSVATDINNHGQILADGRYLLTPIPEPGTLGLLCIGLTGMWLARRKRTT